MYYYSPFRATYNKDNVGGNIPQKKGCVFCDDDVIQKQIIRNIDGVEMRNKHYVWIVNMFPKFEGHTMIVPIKHMTQQDRNESIESLQDRHSLIVFAQDVLRRMYPGCGIENFIQYGEGSESSIPHIHWHILPAMPHDKLRSFQKLGHFYTTQQDERLIVDFPIEIQYAKEVLQNKLANVIGNSVL